MASILFHDHTLVSIAVYHAASGNWKPTASVTWTETGGVTRMKLVTTSPELFASFKDAENAGLEAARNRVKTKCSKAVS